MASKRQMQLFKRFVRACDKGHGVRAISLFSILTRSDILFLFCFLKHASHSSLSPLGFLQVFSFSFSLPYDKTSISNDNISSTCVLHVRQSKAIFLMFFYFKHQENEPAKYIAQTLLRATEKTFSVIGLSRPFCRPI